MISSILNDRQLADDLRRENRAARLKRCILAFLGCAALSGLGVAAYYVYHALSR